MCQIKLQFVGVGGGVVVVVGLGGLSDSVRQLIAISKAWTTVQMATAKWYTDYHSQTLKPC